MTCTTCHADCPPAALYHFDAARTCPLCMARRHEREMADPERFRRAALHPEPAHGLVVVDVERGMAGRVAAMDARRRRA